MKTKSPSLIIAGILAALLFNTLVGIVLSVALDVSPVIMVFAVNAIGFMPSVIKLVNPQSATAKGMAMAGLAREVYLAELMQHYRSNGQWLARARDLSMYVQNEAINLAEAGSDPDVIMDYDHVDPLPVANDEDTPIIISLRSFSTERSKITESAQDTRAYSIMSDRMRRHADTLNQSILKYSAFAFAPNQHSALTPLVETDGDTLGGFKRASLDNIISLQKEMNNMDVDGARILVLTPDHLADLQAEDKTLFKGFTPQSAIQGFDLLGFVAYVSTAIPRYYDDNGTTKIKPWNSAIENTDMKASFAFVENEVGRAQGSIKVFLDKDDATYQASFVSTRSRFLAVKMRNKYVAALVPKTA